ncbi:MAG: ABC transporter ATP-binding protein [Streptococcus sp.]|nr:ABC transporter ATP-binding protein [Streptococcus sp.]
MTILKVKDVHKSYQINSKEYEVALNGINLQLEEQKIIVIYGPSGCGKTSLLNIISGLDCDYKGDVLFKKQSLSNYSQEELTLFRKEHIGFVFQNFNLIAHQTVLDNVKMPLRLKGLSDKEMNQIAEKHLKQLGMLEFKSKNVKQLSGGQRQRVAIARALVNSPEIIVADEPTGALDSNSQVVVLDIFKKLVANGKTIIIVTHNPDVADYADVIIKMKDGEVIEKIER